MSMTQEEIEALMSESTDLSPAIEESAPIEEDNDVQMSADDIAALVASSDTSINESSTVEIDNMDDVLAGIDGLVEDNNDDISDVLAGIDGITEDTSSNNSQETQEENNNLDSQIEQGIYPLPVEKEHKVVNQLHEVAEDSEEKATKIFDVLSFILDENNDIQKSIKDTSAFLDQQIILLETLSKKFPGVAVFSENLAIAKSLIAKSSEASTKIDEENNQIFTAMDLMQFHDINRQKIERVMSVIKKLTTYLNGIFEDDTGKADVQIAKHISGDSADTVTEDDLDSLIAEFSN